MNVLGIETSCDETAIAVVNCKRKIILNEIYTQNHAKYGGVVPEVAARNHIEILPNLLRNAINTKQCNLKNIDAIAVTAGPGLIGGVMVGVMFAQSLASALKIPCIPINHLEGHALTVRLTNNVKFPYLLMLLSGGHCQILYVHNINQYTLIGSTRDDAVGEAFDKVAKMLHIPYPGGPIIEQLALQGDCNAYDFPKAFIKEAHCDMSFSGIKTAVLRQIAKYNGDIDHITRCNIAASFQKAIAITLSNRLQNAIKLYQNQSFQYIAIAGGVAANKYIINELNNICNKNQKILVSPPISLCTDNAAMIAWVGIEKIFCNHIENNIIVPRSKWPLH